jgi:sodium/hydrogen antiporter
MRRPKWLNADRDASRYTPVIGEHALILALAGLAFLAAAWLPAALDSRPLSLPIVLLALGGVVFLLPGLDAPEPQDQVQLTERLTELGVIVSLLGAGLKLDRPLGWRRWSTTWRLLGITMPLSIAGVALLGWGLVGLAPASAMLLGAAIAPTDPVLAADVQVGEPTVAEAEGETEELGRRADEEDDVRFTLTSEAGLNDGLAFPFVYAAIAMATAGATPAGWIGTWLLVDVAWRIGIGVAVGAGTGLLLGVVTFRPPGRLRALAENREGFVALAATFLSYGLAELAHGYGFLAVFVTALTLRRAERGHSYHRVLHNFSAQIEQVLVVVLLVLLGGAVTSGLLADLSWQGVVLAFLTIAVIRPVAALVALLGSSLPQSERWTIGIFGIRGIGSLYYVAYALGEADFADVDVVWSTLTFVILCSIVVHGVAATPSMRRLDRHTHERRQAGPKPR